MNRRGQLSIVLVFLVALVLVIITLIGFFSFNDDFENISKDYSYMSSELSGAEKYVFSSAESIGFEAISNCISCTDDELKQKFMELASERDFGYYGAGNFFGEIRNGKFSFVKTDNGYLLGFENKIFVQSKNGFSEIKRYFDLEVEFNLEKARFINER